jgi:hypothetical protein
MVANLLFVFCTLNPYQKRKDSWEELRIFLALSKLGNINMLKNYEICIIGISFHKSSLALTKAWHRQRRQSVQ